MPQAAKSFRLHDNPATQKPARESACKRGYDADWQRFRKWFATVVIPVCGAKIGGTETQFCCGKSLPSAKMHLDHLKAFDGLDDPLRFDENNVAWRCASCHALKTNAKDGGGWKN